MTFIQCSPTADETTPVTTPQSSNPMTVSTQDPMPIVQPVGLAFPANETFIKVSKEAMASVVNISSSRKAENNKQSGSSPFFDDPFFRRFFGEEFEQRFGILNHDKNRVWDQALLSVLTAISSRITTSWNRQMS